MRRALLLCGVLSPLLYAAADVLAGLRWDGYSFRDQTISELGAIGAPSRAESDARQGMTVSAHDSIPTSARPRRQARCTRHQ